MAKAKTEKIKEEKILGIENPVIKEEKKDYDYKNKNIKYKITNLIVKNTPITVTGDLVETFIGGRNVLARTQLRDGAKKVITKDIDGNDIYKIEVIE